MKFQVYLMSLKQSPVFGHNLNFSCSGKFLILDDGFVSTDIWTLFSRGSWKLGSFFT